MIELSIPGSGTFVLEHLVLDFNGTLACDGRLLPGVGERLTALARRLRVHVVTADTFGQAKEALRGLPCGVSVLPAGNQAEAKLAYLRKLDAAKCASIGNGRNDRLMLEHAALGIAVIQQEGAATAALAAADVVATSILDALDLLANPLRLVATLRD
jgi:soluble P-type ATPase